MANTISSVKKSPLSSFSTGSVGIIYTIREIFLFSKRKGHNLHVISFRNSHLSTYGTTGSKKFPVFKNKPFVFPRCVSFYQSREKKNFHQFESSTTCTQYIPQAPEVSVYGRNYICCYTHKRTH